MSGFRLRRLRWLSVMTAVAAGLAGPAVMPDHGPVAVAETGHVDSVTFALTRSADGKRPRVLNLEMHCGDQTAARATLVDPYMTERTRTLRPPEDRNGTPCSISHQTKPQPGRVDEVMYTVRQGEAVLARRTLYSSDGGARSTDFLLPPGDIHVGLSVKSLAADKVGTPMRMMSMNIRSGTLPGLATGFDGGQQNLSELIEFFRAKDPDVLFVVEMDGSGEAVLAGLNEGLPVERHYTGIQVTREPGQAPDNDNLWLFTRLDVLEVYPRLEAGDLDSFNFGGARLGLPSGGHIHAFSTWLHSTVFGARQVNEAALEETLGLPRTRTKEMIENTDAARRLGMARTLLNERLQTYVGADDAPVFLGGDFNAMSHVDWGPRFAEAFGHAGMVFDWPVMRMFDDAGFVDNYRWANPDVARFPGATWSPVNDCGYAPCRIDYILARGDDVRVLAAHSATRRLSTQHDTELDALFPFYSDHGAVIADVLIRGDGLGPDPDEELTSDVPADVERTWPAPPRGVPVPVSELSATASSQQVGAEASLAVDGSLRADWVSQFSPVHVPHPHEITIDTGRVRTLSAVRYQPRVVGNLNGTTLRAVVQVGEDGSTFHDVTRVTWERTSLPNDIDLNGVRGRYVRFLIELGVNNLSSAAEITPFEHVE